MRFKHSTVIIFSGLIWLAAGCSLLNKGLHFILENESSSIKEQTALLCVAFGLVVGFVKARMVLSKSVKRVVERIYSFPSPVKLSQCYSPRYYILIGSMVLLGIGIKWLSLNDILRGTIDVAIGSALMNGALYYFRAVFSKKQEA